jgi:exodeoxyribonuclease V alpha subunit
VAFIVDYEPEEGDVLLSLDEGEREIVVPVSALETYDLGWALTVHRSQGSQFPAVVAPWSTAYSVMLSRALLYTAVTRAQRLCVLIGERRAVTMALARGAQRPRNSALAERILN